METYYYAHEERHAEYRVYERDEEQQETDVEEWETLFRSYFRRGRLYPGILSPRWRLFMGRFYNATPASRRVSIGLRPRLGAGPGESI